MVTDADLDQTWTMVAGMIVMFMQAGFSMVEAGSVGSKNTQGILVKNLLDACIGAVFWFLFGYGFAFGEDESKFIGNNLFLGQNKDYENTHYVGWFFQWAFCATAATIVSGAVAERVSLHAYAVFMVIMTSFIYPTVVHWTWGGGFLSDGDEGVYTDFAGSGIVHMTGGVAAFWGALILGPRKGRFDPVPEGEESAFVPHNIPMVVLGGFILWFGWYGFNCGSTTAMTGGSANTAALVAMNTTLAAAMGGITVFYTKLLVTKQHDVCALTNGVLSGLVSITAGCDGVYGWAAVVIGFIGGLIYVGTSALMKRCKIDDVVDAFAVHGVCGAWGVMAVAFFNFTGGIFYGGEDSGTLLRWQVIGILAIVAWTSALSGLTFFALKMAGILRLSAEEEEAGADFKSPYKAYEGDSPGRKSQLQGDPFDVPAKEPQANV